MGIERAHDPAHVDALLVGLQADGAGDAGFQRQIAVVAGVKADRQAEIGNPHMLDLLFCTANEACRTILQVGQRGAIGRVGLEPLGILPRQVGIGVRDMPRQQPCNRRIELGNLLLAGRSGPGAQHIEGGRGLIFVRGAVQRGKLYVHRRSLCICPLNLGAGTKNLHS